MKGDVFVYVFECVFVAHFFLDYGGKYQGMALKGEYSTIRLLQEKEKSKKPCQATIKKDYLTRKCRIIAQENKEKCFFFWSGCF